MSLKYTLDNLPAESIPSEINFNKNILTIRFQLAHITHVIIEEKDLSNIYEEELTESEQDQEEQKRLQSENMNKLSDSAQNFYGFVTAKKEREKRNRQNLKNKKKKEYEFFTARIRNKKIVFRKTCYIHEICEDLVVKTFSISDINIFSTKEKSELMKILDFPTLNVPFNVQVFGIELSQDEKNKYIDQLRIQTYKLINKYLLKHNNKSFKLPLEESKILSEMHKQLNDDNLIELESHLHKTLGERNEIIKTGQYYMSIEETKMPNAIFYIEDNVAQRILSIKDQKIKEYDLKVYKLEIDESFDFSEIKYSKLLTFENINYNKEFYFVLKNYVVITSCNKILNVIEIREIKYIVQTKVYRHGNKILIVGGYVNQKGVEENNQILLIEFDKNIYQNELNADNHQFSEKTTFKTIEGGKFDQFNQNCSKDRIKLFNRHIFDSHKKDNLLILLSKQKDSVFIDIFNIDACEIIHQVNLNTFHSQILSFMDDYLLCVTDGFQTKLFDLHTGEIENELRIQHSFKLNTRCWLRSLETERKIYPKDYQMQKNDILINLTNKPILFSDGQITFLFNSLKSYKLNIHCTKPVDILNMIILKLRSYWFLQTCDLLYAQKNILPFLQNFSSFLNQEKNKEFYDELIIMAYENKKIKKEDIFEELVNLFETNVLNASIEEIIG